MFLYTRVRTDMIDTQWPSIVVTYQGVVVRHLPKEISKMCYYFIFEDLDLHEVPNAL